MKKRIFLFVGVLGFATLFSVNVNLNLKKNTEDVLLSNIVGVAAAQTEGGSVGCAMISTMVCKTQIYPYYYEFIGYPYQY